jgi:hypothetical protein
VDSEDARPRERDGDAPLPGPADTRERRRREREERRQRPRIAADPKYGRYVGVLALVILVLITINTVVTKTNGAKGIPAGENAPPFAVPIATGNVVGDADVAVRAHEGAEGNVPACHERGTGILNICELFQRGPVVLALFVNAGGCADVLDDMQALAPSFPGVSFAGVAIKGDRGALRSLVAKHHITFPVGLDRDGILARLYRLATCPQVSFLLPGGQVESSALLRRPSRSQLRERVAELSREAHRRSSETRPQ